MPSEELAVQVSYSLTDDSTLDREKGALVKFANCYDVKNALIVTRDSEQLIEENGLKIEIVPIGKWLLL